MTVKELREEITLNVNEMNEEQLKFLLELLNINRYISKDEIVRIFSDGEIKTFDSAVDINVYRRVEESYPSIKEANVFQDYTDGGAFGRLRNLNDVVANKVLKFFGELW